MQKGFLKEASLYGPGGSSECTLTHEQRKRIEENDFQHKSNAKLNQMLNRGGEGEVAPWYTPEFPKGCQYNAPGCSMAGLASSEYSSDLHRQLLHNSSRWQEFKAAGNLKEVSLAYSSMKDDDIDELIATIRSNHNDTLISLDLSCNNIMDSGLQKLVTAFVTGCAPKLKELRLFENKFTNLGLVTVTQGLSVFRNDLLVVLDTPSYLKSSN